VITTAPPDMLLGEPTARDMVRTDAPVFDVADNAVAAYAVVNGHGSGVALVSRGGVLAASWMREACTVRPYVRCSAKPA
jgi:hypothetical protein